MIGVRLVLVQEQEQEQELELEQEQELELELPFAGSHRIRDRIWQYLAVQIRICGIS